MGTEPHTGWCSLVFIHAYVLQFGYIWGGRFPFLVVIGFWLKIVTELFLGLELIGAEGMVFVFFTFSEKKKCWGLFSFF